MTQGTTDSQTSRLRALCMTASGRPLFVFPGVHERPAALLGECIERLGASRTIYAFEHIGAAGECAPVRQVNRLAQLYAAELRAAEPHAPYYLLGHGIGGVIAFEVARELDSQGQKVGLVILVDCAAPGYPKRVGLARRSLALAAQFRSLGPAARGRWLGERLRDAQRHVRERLRLDAPNQQARREPAHVQRVMAALHEAYRHYQPSPQCVDVLLLSAERPYEWPAVWPVDPLLGWGPALRGRISQRTQRTGACLFAPENLHATVEHIDSALKHAELRRTRRRATPLPAAS